LNGRLSQKEAVSQFNCKPSTISEAFKILAKRRRLIHHTNAPEHDNLNNVKRGSTRIKFYKLSREGLLAFINENPSPEEFWRTIIWFCSLITKDINNAEFNRYYDLFIQKFVGSFLFVVVSFWVISLISYLKVGAADLKIYVICRLELTIGIRRLN
jgi:hypothetical protein